MPHAAALPDARPGRRTAIRALAVTAAAGAVGAGVVVAPRLLDRRRGLAEVPLLSSTVAMDATGRRLLVGGPGTSAAVEPGTRLIAGTASESAVARRARAFLDGADPWLASVPSALTDLAGTALQDLWVLSDSLLAPVAGWSSNWRFIWPRDTAFSAVALARIGHADAAVETLAHLQGLQAADGWFEARYSPTTGTAPDKRPRQFDGTGLALWAVAEVLEAVPPGERDATRDRLSPLMTVSRRALRSATSAGTSMPPVSPDYWEVSEHAVTLGIMASTLAGLRANARLTGADDDARAAEAFQRVLVGGFGTHGYQRYPRSGGADSAAAFLEATGSPGIFGAERLHDLRRTLGRPGGGIAPGARWKHDGISWTPSTSLLGLALARAGDADGARSVLEWIASHRTDDGSIPEKVLHDGRPAAVAPLAWSAANVLLTIDALRTP